MFYVYLTIIAGFLALIIWNFITEKDWIKKIGIAMVIIPFLLRLFMIK